MAEDRDKNEPKSHWIEELFPPKYGVTLDEVLEGKMPEYDDYVEPVRLQRVSVYNPDSIKKVYERVRMTMAVGEEIKEQEKRNKSPVKHQLTIGTEENIKLEEIQDNNVAETFDLNDPCIWDTEEISVLRKVYKAAKGEIAHLNVNIREANTTIAQLTNRLSDVESQLRQSKSGHSEALKANCRLKIHCDTLQEELGLANHKIDTLQDVFDETKEDRGKCVAELHKTRLGLDKGRLKYKQLKLKYDGLEEKYASEKVIAEENIKLNYEQDILDLQKRVAEMSLELEKEKNQHSVTRKGLEQLQKHFATLPQPSGFPNAVLKDEIKRFQY